MRNDGGATPKPGPGWFARLWVYLMRHRRNLYLGAAGALIGAACQTAVPLVAREIVDQVIIAHTSALWPWLVLMSALAALTFLAAHVRRYRGGQVSIQVQNDLRLEMQAHLQRLDFESLGQMPTGQLVARANSDTALVQGLIAFFPMMSSNVLLMIASIAVMLWLSPLLAVVSLVLAPTLLVVSYRMRQRVHPATWDAQQREGDVIQIVDEDVNGVRVVKAFGQEDRELHRVVDSAQSLYGARMRSVRLQARYQPLLQAIPSIGQAAILGLGGWMALDHRITLGTFLAFSTYLTSLMAPARQIAGVLTIAQQARAGVERILQLLDLPSAVTDAPGALDLGQVRGNVRFENVHFSYGEGPEVLTGVDLEVSPGERVAIVGGSGSGKSTLAHLVPRFYDPSAGRVLIDGVDLKEATLASLRRQIGVVFEESFLFSDTVRANIAFGRPGASDAEVEAAARAAQADEFVRALPRGYETVVGERGLTLSGGQRQRIALARAILYDPRVLILDDATSAVDARVEEAIFAALDRVLEGRTTILVAHRVSTLRLADRVVVLEEGRVVEQGTHDELLQRSAHYRGLLSGLEEAAAARVGDSVERLSDLEVEGAVTPSAWARVESAGPLGRPTVANPRGPSLGAGLGGGGGGGGGGWRLNLAPTPELLERVAQLPPVRDTAELDLEHETRHERRFTLAGLLGEFRAPLALGLVLVVLDALMGLAGPILVKSGIDDGVQRHSLEAVLVAALVLLAITLVDLVDSIGETFVTGGLAERVMLSLRLRIWAQLQRLSLDYYEGEMAGRIMTRMTTDVDQFESLVENGVLSALVAIVTFVGVAVALIVINPELGLCTMSVIVPLALATTTFRRRTAVVYDQSRERIAAVNADFQESLSGVRESQAFVHEDATIRRFEELSADYVKTRVRAQRLVGTYFPFIQFLSGLGDVIVLGVGASLVASGQLTAGGLIAFVLYIDMFFSPIQSLSQVFDSWQQTRVSIGRVGELMALETGTPAAPEARPAPRLSGQVTLSDVHFAYPTSGRRAPGPPSRRVPSGRAADEGPAAVAEALSGVSLEVAAGETIALVGETGAGKSTVMKMIARFYDPTSGSVTVDGLDLRDLDLAQYRGQLGYVPQEAFLFSGTIRDNIAYGRPAASDAEVEAAARAVGAHDFIARLAGGYLHEVVERGRTLSAGQRQLIALARAQLVDPAILLLDEATSQLDLLSEARVSAAMERLASGRTTILIAHRLQTAMGADRIVVLHAGRIAEVGTHDELLALGGRYSRLWAAFAVVERAQAAAS